MGVVPQSPTRQTPVQVFAKEISPARALWRFASKSELNGLSAKGANYDSQGQALSRAKCVAPGSVRRRVKSTESAT